MTLKSQYKSDRVYYLCPSRQLRKAQTKTIQKAYIRDKTTSVSVCDDMTVQKAKTIDLERPETRDKD